MEPDPLNGQRRQHCSSSCKGYGLGGYKYCFGRSAGLIPLSFCRPQQRRDRITICKAVLPEGTWSHTYPYPVQATNDSNYSFKYWNGCCRRIRQKEVHAYRAQKTSSDYPLHVQPTAVGLNVLFVDINDIPSLSGLSYCYLAHNAHFPSVHNTLHEVDSEPRQQLGESFCRRFFNSSRVPIFATAGPRSPSAFVLVNHLYSNYGRPVLRDGCWVWVIEECTFFNLSNLLYESAYHAFSWFSDQLWVSHICKQGEWVDVIALKYDVQLVQQLYLHPF